MQTQDKTRFGRESKEQSVYNRAFVSGAKVLHSARIMVIRFSKGQLTKKTSANVCHFKYFFHLWVIHPNNSLVFILHTQLIHFSIPPPMLVFYVVTICLLAVRAIPYVSSYLETGLRR